MIMINWLLHLRFYTMSQICTKKSIILFIMTDQLKPIKGKLRTLRCDLGFLKRADASASFEQGKAIVWASVNGPGDVMASKRLSTQMLVEISNRRVTDPGSKDLIHSLVNPTIMNAIEKDMNPRASLVITLQEMNRDGEYTPVAINAACMALLDADVDGFYTIDPDTVTIDDSKAVFIFVFRPAPTDIVCYCIGSSSSGVYNMSEFYKALEYACPSAFNILEFYNIKMDEKYSPWQNHSM